MAGSSFNLAVNEKALAGVIASVGASAVHINKAAEMAAKRTLSMLQTRIKREVAAALNIPQKNLNARLVIRRGGKASWVLFFGINRMPYDKTGAVKQNTRGMTHRSGDIKSGFTDKMGGSSDKGWIRKGRAKQLGIKLPGLAGGKPDDGRLPILRISHDLDAAAQPVFARHEKAASRIFHERFEHELRRLSK